MEQIDLKQIKLKDTGIYGNEKYNFYHAFKMYNITTVDQVLNDNLMNKVMQHFMKDNRIELRRFIEFLKYKYLGIHFSNNDILDKKPINSDYKMPYDLRDDFSSLGLIGLHIDARTIIDKKIKELNENRKKLELTQDESSPEYIGLKSIISEKQQELINLKIIDILKEIMKESDKPETKGKTVTFQRLKLRIESYEQSKQLALPIIAENTQNGSKSTSQQEYDTLVILRDQLVKLIDVRDKLNTQIEDLQKEINELVKTNNKGGANK